MLWLPIEDSAVGAIEFVTPLKPSRVVTNFRSDPHNTLWITMTRAVSGGAQNFSLDLLNDCRALYKKIQSTEGNWHSGGATQSIRYAVVQSANPDYFSLGGDIGHFRDCIRQRNREALKNYCMMCLDMVYAWAGGLSDEMTTISLVQGRALGGGFEVALASDYIIAEEQSEFGFPEILFGLFPCTGGMSLLCQRVSVHQAERMMSDGKIYSAEELKALGVVE